MSDKFIIKEPKEEKKKGGQKSKSKSKKKNKLIKPYPKIE